MGGKTIWNKLNSNQRRDYIYQAFLNRGYNPIQASAIVGNLQQENGSFGTSTKNSQGSGATGIAQWLGSRKKQLLKDYKEWYDIDNQIDFIDREIKGDREAWTNNMGGKSAFFNAKDVDTAVKVFRKDFERPGEKEANDTSRIKNAYSVLGSDYTPSQYANIPNQNNYVSWSQPTSVNTEPYSFQALTDSYLETQRLEQEKINQEIISNDWERQNKEIEVALRQKQIERQQLLNSIPQAQSIDSNSNLQANPFTSLLQNETQYMQQGGRVAALEKFKNDYRNKK